MDNFTLQEGGNQGGDKDENMSVVAYQGGSKSPPYDDSHRRRYSDRSYPCGRSPGDYKRSHSCPPVINDWHREDSRISDGDSKTESQSAVQARNLGSSSPPVGQVQPIRQVLLGSSNDGNSANASALTQGTAFSGSLVSSNESLANINLETTKSLHDPEPIAPTFPQAQQTCAPQPILLQGNSSDDNRDSFDVGSEAKANQSTSNLNPLESVVSQLSYSAPLSSHASGVQGDTQVVNYKRSHSCPPVINDWHREDRRISDVVPPKPNSGKAADASALTQRTASSGSLISSNESQVNINLETTKGLHDPEPIAPTFPQVQQTSATQPVLLQGNSSDDNRDSFDVGSEAKANQSTSNLNPLESVVSQLSYSAPLSSHASGVQGDTQVVNYKRSHSCPPVINDWHREDRRISDVVPPKPNSGKAADASALTQRTASSGSLISSNESQVNINLETTKGLHDPEPIAPTFPQVQQTSAPHPVLLQGNSSDDNGDSFDIVSEAKANQSISNLNPLESVVSQLSYSAPLSSHASGFQDDTQVVNYKRSHSCPPVINDSASLSSHASGVQGPIPAGAHSFCSLSSFPLNGASTSSSGQWASSQHQQPMFSAENSQPSNVPFVPKGQGYPNTPMPHAYHHAWKPVNEDINSILSQPSALEVKPSEITELSEVTAIPSVSEPSSSTNPFDVSTKQTQDQDPSCLVEEKKMDIGTNNQERWCGGLRDSWCGIRLKNISSPSMARYFYAFIFLAANVLAWSARDALPRHKGSRVCRICKRFLGANGVLRVSMGCFLFFMIMFCSTTRTSKLNEVRNKWHSGWWSVKIVTWILLTIFPFLLTTAMMELYGQVAQFGSGVFLLIQLISTINFINWLNGYFASVERFKIHVKKFATALYFISLVGIVWMYIWYAPIPSCLLNIFFITCSFVLLIVMTIVSLHPKVNGGFLSPGLMGLYVVYLCWSAIKSEPYKGDQCTKKAPETHWLNIISFVIGILVIVYATFSSGIDSESFQLKKSEKAREENDVPYGYGFFHFVYAVGAMHFAMLMNDWNSHHASKKWSLNVGWISVWVGIVTQWLTVCVYLWILIASIWKNKHTNGIRGTVVV